MITEHDTTAILWDIDGTLILTEELHFQTIVLFCADRGITLSDTDNNIMLGKSMPEKWRYLRDVHGISDSEHHFRDICARTYMSGLKACEIRRSPMQLLAAAATMGIRQACVSNGDRAIVQANVQRLELSDTIEFALSSDDFSHGKPNPAPYLRACEKLGLQPGQCIAIEDSPVGVESAKAAGLTVVAWPAQCSLFHDEAFSKANYHIHSLNEFPLHLLQMELMDVEALT